MATPHNTDLKGPLAARLAPFEALDACHREVVAHLQTLNRLVLHLDAQGLDDQARSMAAEVVGFFNETAQQHHAEEERLVFPPLLAGTDPDLIEHVRHLQMDHGWLEEDWKQLELQLGAVSGGYSWFDLDELRSGSEVFTALYHDHIALEESLVYPEAMRVLNAEIDGLGRRLARVKRESARP
jgi:hemerythrin-like domain-containing protein